MWGSYGLGPLTLVLIGACGGLAVVAGFPPSDAVHLADEPYYRHLYITLLRPEFGFLPEVRQGEVWRLITPIFIHMSIVHLLFNMLWLKDLGSMIEARKGTWTLLLLVLVIGVCSNLGQDLLSGPDFGGMSGVLYGLFGFIWMRGKFDPASGLRLNQANVVMMVGWFFLCLFGIIPNVANGAHGVGLVMGMIWGAGPPLAKKAFETLTISGTNAGFAILINQSMNESFRTESDSMGPMQIPAGAYYGAQTARAVENFPISNLRFPRSFIRALGLIKKHAALTNQELGGLPAAPGRGHRPGRAGGRRRQSGTRNSCWIFSRPAPAPRPT